MIAITAPIRTDLPGPLRLVVRRPLRIQPLAPPEVDHRPSRRQPASAQMASVYRRRRLVALTLFTALVAGSVIGVQSLEQQLVGSAVGPTVDVGIGPPAPTPAPVHVEVAPPLARRSHVVRSGDTLWSIAGSLAPGRDRRPLVDEIAALNGGSTIRVGERLWLPSGIDDVER